NNKIIPNSDSASTKWDIGFRGTTIITNSGNSGPATGGAFIYVGLFDGLKTKHADSVFKVDNAPSAYAITSGSNRGWYVYDGINNLINPIPGRVLVIRTASGKFAKIEIINYYKGGVTPPASASDAFKSSEQRYYTFRFTFQPNGTKVF
ncbi:MAG: HmuY family protein, partial [Ignavibacteria bacterium]|nr:HmuY family protein [Ignavibacteria bacterium]